MARTAVVCGSRGGHNHREEGAGELGEGPFGLFFALFPGLKDEFPHLVLGICDHALGCKKKGVVDGGTAW